MERGGQESDVGGLNGPEEQIRSRRLRSDAPGEGRGEGESQRIGDGWITQGEGW